MSGKPRQKIRRIDRGSVHTDDGDSNDAKFPLTPESPLPSPQQSKSPSYWFVTEIQQMLYGLGDCQKPNMETTVLIEEILYQQLITALLQAAQVAISRNSRFISVEDFLFLMRKDKVKLTRLVRSLSLKGLRASAMKGNADEEADGEGKSAPAKWTKTCYDFLSSIDQTGELLSIFEDEIFDEVKHQRAVRADVRAKSLDSVQYKEFSEARRTNFAPKIRPQKFREWILLGYNSDPKPNNLALEVLSYLAFELVAQIVDLSFLVRQDSTILTADPFSTAMPTVNVVIGNIGAGGNSQPTQSSSSTSTASTKSPASGRPSSPLAMSPPSTPSTPLPSPRIPQGGSSLPSLTTSNGSLNKSTTKSRKRKAEANLMKDLQASQAIQPSEVREVLRRYSQHIGPWADFYKKTNIDIHQKILCF